VTEKNCSISQTLTQKHELHVASITSKLATENERKKDRNGEIPVLCFDLENVISLPRANVSN